jgi:hypothetical protein
MYPSYETIAAQKAAIIPSSRCIKFHLPTCVNLQVPMTLDALVIGLPWQRLGEAATINLI